MLKFLLLLFSVAGFHARPLQYNDLRIQNGGWVIGAPQLVRDGQEYMGNSVAAKHPRQDKKQAEPQWEVVLAPVHKVKMQDDMKQKAAPIEEHRQDTEPSKRLVVDLNTGLLKEYIVYNPVSNAEFRQGTQNSRATLVNIRTGQQLPQLTEMQRRAEPLSQYRQGTEYTEPTLLELRNPQMMRSMEKANVNKQEATHKSYNPVSNAEFRQGTQDSRVTLVNIRTGQRLPQLTEMQRRAEPLSQYRQGTEYTEPTLLELRNPQMMRSMDKPNVNKQEATHKFYNPVSNAEFRQGTQDSRATLVNIRTGQQLPQLSEMQRRAEPLSQYRQGTEYTEPTLLELRNPQMMRSMDKPNVNKQEATHKFYNPVSNAEFRQGTQDSRVTLVNIRTGQQLPQLSEMQRRAEPLSQFRQGTEYTEPTLLELRNPQMMRSMDKSNVNKQEATHRSYNPVSNAEFRQGTQDSRVTLVNIRTGQQLPQLSEMQRRGEPFEFKQGTEFSLVSLMNLRRTKMTAKTSVQDMETNEVFPEFKRGIEYSQAQRRHVIDQHRFQALGSNEVEISPDFGEFGHDTEFIHANLIDRRFMERSHVKQI
ncbi:uncharacterized protein wu:fa56d06 isoform X1 [Tachysurus fulvidraco]|uniref:uncharacterized protein wu:fa56d06 isoform X1 n=1 Tax=Tachysurus fulvidraco TaxID=1234273 RepID=UPI001FF016B8|nr:uncharacterized protein wu:fa56d06 isoform X1 [Tachysurus fulvidraco]